MGIPHHAHNLLLHALSEGGLLAGMGLLVWPGGVTWLLVRARAWPGRVILAVALLLNPLWIGMGWSPAASRPTGRGPPGNRATRAARDQDGLTRDRHHDVVTSGGVP